MTLLVTELTEYGIAMAAETALPPLPPIPPSAATAGDQHRVPTVRPIPYLQAGIGVWGCRGVLTSSGWISAGNWLGDFIAKQRGVADLKTFADQLAQTLRALRCQPQDPVGFHIAGYTVEPCGQRRPVFLHVSNTETDFQEYYLRDFGIVQAYGLQATETLARRFVGCDIGAYGRLWERMEAMLPAVDGAAVPGLPRPQPSLPGRTAHLVACMQFVAGLYVSGIPGQLGSTRVELLSVPPQGDSAYRIIHSSPEPADGAAPLPSRRPFLRAALARDVGDG